jgi:hypothetical protein
MMQKSEKKVCRLCVGCFKKTGKRKKKTEENFFECYPKQIFLEF